MLSKTDNIDDCISLTGEERLAAIDIVTAHAEQQQSRGKPDPKYSKRGGTNICISGAIGDLALRKRLGVSTEPLCDVTNRAKFLPRDATVNKNTMVYDDGDLRFHCIDKENNNRQVIVVFENKTFCGSNRNLPLKIPENAENPSTTKRRYPFEIYIYNSIALSDSNDEFDDYCDGKGNESGSVKGLSAVFRGCYASQHLCRSKQCDTKVCPKIHAQVQEQGSYFLVKSTLLVPLQTMLDRFGITCQNEYAVPDTENLKQLCPNLKVDARNAYSMLPTGVKDILPLDFDDDLDNDIRYIKVYSGCKRKRDEACTQEQKETIIQT